MPQRKWNRRFAVSPFSRREHEAFSGAIRIGMSGLPSIYLSAGHGTSASVKYGRDPHLCPSLHNPFWDVEALDLLKQWLRARLTAQRVMPWIWPSSAWIAGRRWWVLYFDRGRTIILTSNEGWYRLCPLPFPPGDSWVSDAFRAVEGQHSDFSCEA